MSRKPLHCPNCQKRVTRDGEHFPFCSRRCRLIDLGDWLGGSYRVAGKRVDLSQELGQEDGQDSE